MTNIEKAKRWEKGGKVRSYFNGTNRAAGFHYEIGIGWSFAPRSKEMKDFQKETEKEILKAESPKGATFKAVIIQMMLF